METVLRVGAEETIQTLEAAFERLPENSGDVRIILEGSLKGPADQSLSIPENKGVTLLTIESAEPDQLITVETVLEIFANGIPFILGENISLPNAWIFGGKLAVNGTSRTVPSTNVTIQGNAAYVVGGGAANSGGRSVVTGETNVVIGPRSSVYWQVFGGGYALGQRSIAEVRISNVTIMGTVDYALGGGLAKDGGRTIIRDRANCEIRPDSEVVVAMFGGGNAVGESSVTEIKDAYSNIHGTAAWAFGGDFTFDGGKSILSGLAQLSLPEDGHVKALYGGSFATDENSHSEVARTRLIVLGSAESITSAGEISYGGISTVSEPDPAF